MRLVLEEEGVDYISRHLDIHGTMDQLEPWYLAVNPAGVVPTLLFRGNAVAESKDISLFAIDGHHGLFEQDDGSDWLAQTQGSHPPVGEDEN